MTKDQETKIRQYIEEYFVSQKTVSKINEMIGETLLLKLASTGIDLNTVQEIYLETIVKHATDNITKDSLDFISKFFPDED